MKIYFFFLLILLSHITVCAKEPIDTIQFKPNAFSLKFIYKGTTYNASQIEKLISSNNLVVNEIKIARTNKIIGNILGGVGGFLLGWNLGTAISGGDPNLKMGGLGLGLIAVSIPYTISYTTHLKKAIFLYNSDLKSSNSSSVGFKLKLCANGGTLALSF